jgi:hypothetical protein
VGHVPDRDQDGASEASTRGAALKPVPVAVKATWEPLPWWTDPQARTVHYAVSFGDGTASQEGDIAAPYDAVTVPHTYANAGAYRAVQSHRHRTRPWRIR